MKRTRIFRSAGWLAVASLLGAALIAPAAAFATTGDWQGNGYPSNSCGPETTGTMLWIWTGDSPTSLTINGELQSGTWVQQGGGSSSYHMTLDISGTNYPPTSASVDFTGDAGVLTLSGCNEGTTTTTTTSESSSTTEETTSSSTTEQTTASTTTEETTASTTTEETTASTTTEETTASTTTEETTASSTTEETTSSSTTEETTSSTTEESSTTSEESTPSGSVEAETGTPQVTPPSTDTIGGTGSTPSNGGWQLALVAMAGLLATVLVLTPAAKKRRR